MLWLGLLRINANRTQHRYEYAYYSTNSVVEYYYLFAPFCYSYLLKLGMLYYKFTPENRNCSTPNSAQKNQNIAVSSLHKSLAGCGVICHVEPFSLLFGTQTVARGRAGSGSPR